MDATSTELVDQIVEDEIQRGYKVVAMPKEYARMLIEARLEDPKLPQYTRYRFTKLTPRKRSLIATAVQKRYHADLVNQDLLGRDKIRKLNIERGAWSVEQEKRLEELKEETNALAQQVYLEGMNAEERWAEDRRTSIEAFQASLEAKDEAGNALLAQEVIQDLTEHFVRWLSWSKERQAEFDRLYAASQGREQYSPDWDLEYVGSRLPTVMAIDALNDVVEINDKLERLYELVTKRKEYIDLQVTEAKMYSESLEQRRDQVEEIARLYYLTEQVDDKDMPKGHLTPTLDDLYNMTEDLVQWFIIELHFFLQGIPDEARDYLQTMGFIRAPRQSGSPAVSAESPVEPTSKPDSPASTPTPVASSTSPTPTSSETSSSLSGSGVAGTKP